MCVMQHARNHALREEIYHAYLTRASSDDLDNTFNIDQILKLKLEKAKLIGYNNYAEVSMATKMATVEKAQELIEKLCSVSWNTVVQGAGYNVNYGNPEAGYAGNPYPASYGMNPVQPGAEGFVQYGPGPAWGAYDMQRAQGHR